MDVVNGSWAYKTIQANCYIQLFALCSSIMQIKVILNRKTIQVTIVSEFLRPAKYLAVTMLHELMNSPALIDPAFQVSYSQSALQTP